MPRGLLRPLPPRLELRQWGGAHAAHLGDHLLLRGRRLGQRLVQLLATEEAEHPPAQVAVTLAL